MTDERLDLYKRLLLTWNEKINLIGPEARENLDAHIEEALAAASILEPRGNVLDFGSGGGLPAIPMAIASPEAVFHLVESDQKKWAFLKRAVRECRLNAVVHGDRLARVLTRFPPSLRFSLVTSRAVGKPHEWLPLVAPWMADGGRVGLFQGSAETPAIRSFVAAETFPLRRGTLVTLTFHVEQQ
jgi:16S rRNA (guanine527-N7)-methyltransferase